ncbi:hypothetical protein BV898_02421 [Hypsibius exemplaris]|uniref:MAM domain-containing protein n=1 Tax=Hypsibius exemplaris TaxID=2072580 RepID=A0A1W0X852_HYPEX|nr:hypothetical protein BV898_02421 [Hypsibius exemplaris]
MAWYAWTVSFLLIGLISQCAGQKVDCDFENGPCNWANDHEVVSDPPLNWREVSEIGVLGKDTGHGIVKLRPNYGDHARLLPTNAQIGFLTIWHYWLNEKNQFYSKKVWSNEEETDGGAWKVGQVLIDGAGNWTLIAEVITNPFNIVIPTHPTGGSGIALDNIKQRPVGSADECPTLIGPHVVVETTQAATTMPPPTVPTIVASTQSVSTPAAITGSVGSISVQLGEFIYTPNPEACDFWFFSPQDTCDLQFSFEFLWSSNGTARRLQQNLHDHIPNTDAITFQRIPPAILAGPIPVGSVVTVNVVAHDFDPNSWFGDSHELIASLSLKFTVPQAGTPAEKVSGRDYKDGWYSTMTATFTARQ